MSSSVVDANTVALAKRFPVLFHDLRQWLGKHPEAAREVVGFKAFSDIVFNPEKSLNCQARSAAMFVALSKQGLLAQATREKESYLTVVGGQSASKQRSPVQRDLFSDAG